IHDNIVLSCFAKRKSARRSFPRDPAQSSDQSWKSRLARIVALQVPRKRLDKPVVGQVPAELVGNEGTYVAGAQLQLGFDRQTAGEYRHDVFQVDTGLEVPAAPITKRVELCGQEARSCDEADHRPIGEVILRRGRESCSVPSIRETVNFLD